MSGHLELSQDAIKQIRQNPMHTVLLELGQAAASLNVLESGEFKKLISYLMELADGRDRREPWVQRPGVARPVPKLRVAIDKCFGQYGDLQWFRLNKTTNKSGLPLLGLFPRIAAGVARIGDEDFSELVRALCSHDPDAALLKLLQSRDGGKISAATLGVFSQLAHAFRRDLYFIIPKDWGDVSGATNYIGSDLRKYIALCRSLREVCDRVNLPEDIRGTVFNLLIEQKPIHPALQKALGRAIGPALARFTVLDTSDAFDAEEMDEQFSGNPLDLAATSIRLRRGDRKLRNLLCRAYGNQCAITGPCPKDLLEVAYIVPFPSGSVNSIDNAIVLRSDLHTLWDLNLIAIHPETMRVHISKRLLGSSYEALANGELVESKDGTSVSKRALRERWNAFAAESKRIAAETEKAAAGTNGNDRHGDGERHSIVDGDRRTPEIEIDLRAASGSFAGLKVN